MRLLRLQYSVWALFSKSQLFFATAIQTVCRVFGRGRPKRKDIHSFAYAVFVGSVFTRAVFFNNWLQFWMR